MSVQAATAVMGAFSVGAFLGQLAGGWVGQQLYNIGRCCFLKIQTMLTITIATVPATVDCVTAPKGGPRMQCLLMGCCTILGVFPLLHLLDYGMEDSSQRLREHFFDVPIHCTALVAGTLATITGPNVRAVLQVRTVNLSLAYQGVYGVCNISITKIYWLSC